MADQAGSTPGLLLMPSQQQEQHKCIPEHLMHKNHLQEFTQRAELPFPVYHTIDEGGPRHKPQYRSTVEVNGETYTSLNSYSSRKAAEQDAARLALEGISKKIKDCVSKKTIEGGFPPIHQDKVFCKSILHEFAAKMNKERPTYDTVRVEGLVPVYVSSLVFNGVKYDGQPGVNKKEAEQLVARAAILSILANAGEGMHLSEIVISKARFISAVHDTVCVADPILQPNTGATRGTSAEGDREGTSEIGEVIVFQGQSHIPPKHEFRKPGLDTCSQPGPLPITFVPPAQTQTPFDASACGAKRTCKRKKKANKKGKTAIVPQVLPLNQGTSAGGDSEGKSETGEVIVFQGQSHIPPKHEFRKPGLETSSQPVPLPITFVPPVQTQTPFDASACGAKRKCKKRKKANKKGKTAIVPQALPLSQGMSCTVAQ